MDKLRLIVHPLITGDGKPLFTMTKRCALELHSMRPLPEGRLSLVYAMA